MLKTMILSLLISSPLIACPNLTGKYICSEAGNTKENPTVITQSVNTDGVTVYTIVFEGNESKVVTDGQKRVEGTSTYQYSCINDKQIKVDQSFTIENFNLTVVIDSILTKTNDGYQTNATIKYHQDGSVEEEQVVDNCTKI